MRVVVHEYDTGERYAFETTDDGGEFRAEWSGERKTGQRICAFVEIGCDENAAGIDRLLEAIEWLTEEVKRRKAAPAGV